jgi:hypothetical protein
MKKPMILSKRSTKYFLFFSAISLAIIFTAFKKTAPPLIKSTYNYDVLELKNQEYLTDMTINANKIICKTGGNVKFKNAITVTFITNILEVETPNFTMDGRGDKGTPGAPVSGGNPWMSTNCSPRAFFGGPDCDGHKQWMDAGSAVDAGHDGGPGGPGATIIIKYKIYQGISGGIDNLNIMTQGGEGGDGSQGRTLICGVHNNEVKYGAHGKTGTAGADGKFRKEQL